MTLFRLFAILFVMYFGGHCIYGYFYCEFSEYANCPGYYSIDTDLDEEEEEE